MAENYLPGQPSKLLVRKVRSHLRSFGVVPGKTSREWIETWQWASRIADSYDRFLLMKPSHRKRHRWPRPTEIGSQYMLLILVSMKESSALSLPFRAPEFAPQRLLALGGKAPLALEAAKSSVIEGSLFE